MGIRGPQRWVARESFLGGCGEPELDLGKQAGICWVVKESLDVQGRGSSMGRAR